jgi:branched-chain amino acid transport system substrate-binding protein
VNARTRLCALSVAVAVSVALAACSTSSSSLSAGGSSADGSSAKAASGSPVVIGFTTIENDLGISFTPQEEVAVDLVDHLNAVGGIGGHPIKLVTCAQQVTSGGAQCADQFLQDKAVVVLGYSITDDGAMYPILKSANVPFLGAGAMPGTAAGLTPDGNHFFTGIGPLGFFLAVDNFLATQLHPRKVGVIVSSTTAAQQAADNFIKAPLNKAGIDVTLAPLTASNPDFTSVLNTLSDSDFIFVLSNCNDVDSAFSQAAALGLKTRGFINVCTGASDIKAMGSGAAGKYGFSITVPVDDPRYASQPDVQEFLSLAKHYGWGHSGFDTQVYQLVLSVVSLIKQAGGATATSAQVKAAIANSNGTPLPLGAPGGLNCAKPPSAVVPTACNASGLIVVVQSDGQIRALDGKWVSP